MIKTTPRDHQIEGMKFLARRRGACLGFKTGLGKSLTLLMAIDAVRRAYKKDYLYFMPVILFAPKNAAEKVWPAQIKEHTQFKHIHFLDLIDKTKAGKNINEAAAPYDIIIVRYSQATKYVTQLAELCRKRITCYDEIHQLKNPQAKRTVSIFYATENAVAKWGLTATAVLNSPLDLYGVISFFNPDEFGSVYSFQRKFCITRPQILADGREIRVIEDYKNLDALSRIREKYILSKSQQIDVSFRRIKYSLTTAEEERYLLAAQGLIGEAGSYKDFAPRIPDIQRVADGALDAEGNIRTGRSSKYRTFARAMAQVLKKRESLILFTEYYATLDYLEALLRKDFRSIPVFVISGKKMKYPDKFPCIVLATVGGSESLNLKFANHVFCYSVPFSVGNFIQIVGRITRMDSSYLGNLNVYLPYNENTIDHYKTTLLEYHTEIINRVLGHDANLPKTAGDVRKSLIRKMRKDVLWRMQHVKNT